MRTYRFLCTGCETISTAARRDLHHMLALQKGIFGVQVIRHILGRCLNSHTPD